jgi:hypothetical protein
MTVTIRPSSAYPPPPPAYSTIPMDGRQLAQQLASGQSSTTSPSPSGRQQRSSLGQTFSGPQSAGILVSSLPSGVPHPNSYKGGKLPAKSKAKSSSMISYRAGGSSGGSPTDGCCLIKTFISSVLNAFAM